MTTLTPDHALRQHLRDLLTRPQAHAMLEDVLGGFALDKINERPGGLPYSAYEVLWHLRLAQRDILDFSRPGEYHQLKWPDGYWPHTQQATQDDWDAQIKAYHSDVEALLHLLDDPATDLFAVVPHGDTQTYLREVLLVADHNAYHIGQLALIKRLLAGG